MLGRTLWIVGMLGAASCTPLPPVSEVPAPPAPEPAVVEQEANGAPDVIAVTPSPPPRTPGLPPVPFVDGELALDVGYPREGMEITTRGTNFIFGSTGSGRARVTIDGRPVEVQPNGGFLAFLPVPADGIYRLAAELDGARAEMVRTVLLPLIPPPPPMGTGIQEGSAYPTGPLAVWEGEPVAVGFRGTPGGEGWLLLPGGERVPLVATAGRYDGVLLARPLTAVDPSVSRPELGRLDVGAGRGASLELVFGVDTVRTPLPLNLAVLPVGRPRLGVARRPASAPEDWRARGRNDVAGAYYFFWPDGTQVEVTGQRGGQYRIRLAEGRTAWVPTNEIALRPDGLPVAIEPVGDVRLFPDPAHIEVRVPLARPLPYQVVVEDRVIHLDVFGAVSRTNRLGYGPADPMVERFAWSQPMDGVYRLSVYLRAPVWGYDAFLDRNGSVVLRIRRPPPVDPEAPLAGLRVVLDAGHGGTDRDTRGPTGLTEADANLEVALALADQLTERGAHIVLTRAADATVEITDRPRIAFDTGGHLLVSLHNNAFPDGTDPWPNHGTSVYYNQVQAADLARFLQAELLAELGTRDLGVFQADLALARPTWMPSVLSESLFMMIPEHEAALLDPEIRGRIASAHVRAIEQFVRRWVEP